MKPIPLSKIIGLKFGKLTPISEAPKDSAYRRYFNCVCDCGKTTVVPLTSLRTGNSTSCGCYATKVKSAVHKKHGYYGTSEYRTYHDMIRRCYNLERQEYKRYGGRGITVCDRWRESFENFIGDMGPKLVPSLTLERIDNNGPYSPENCKWATRTEQLRNQRKSRWYTYKGECRSLPQWSEITGISQSVIWQRLECYGWTVEEALETPVGKRTSKIRT